MKTKIAGRHHFDDFHASGLAFWMINLMHDNPQLPLLKNPYRSLETAGLRPGQKVVEVGCGPGFFTIPAAKIVGTSGIVYAVDINPLAVKKVQVKMRKYGIDNIKPILGNAANSGLSDSSIDLAFIFGLRYIAGGLCNLISEIHRILKTDGILSFEKTTGSDDKLVEEVERAGFVKTEKNGRVFVFAKSRNVSL
ncbi:MAG: methyltransferase domain-containing protein [candidate division KSB1 bacterium]|nr:methyltransferase domain-containing protein [candidate division KSB1 bacterium]